MSQRSKAFPKFFVGKPSGDISEFITLELGRLNRLLDARLSALENAPVTLDAEEVAKTLEALKSASSQFSTFLNSFSLSKFTSMENKLKSLEESLVALQSQSSKSPEIHSTSIESFTLDSFVVFEIQFVISSANVPKLKLFSDSTIPPAFAYIGVFFNSNVACVRFINLSETTITCPAMTITLELDS